MKKLALFLLLPVAIIACGEKPEPNPINPEPETSVVNFHPSMSAPSKATETAFEQGDAIGVFAVLSSGDDNKGIIATNGNYADNVKYIYSGEKFIPAGSGIVKPENDGKAYYHAVYPFTSSTKHNFQFSVNTDQEDYSRFTGSDLATASTAATSEQLVALKFSHRLSLLEISLAGDNWPTGAMTLTLKDVYTKANVDLNTLSFTATGTTKDVLCYPDGTKSFKAILPPQAFKKDKVFAILTIGSEEYEIIQSGNMETTSGKKTPVTLTLNSQKEIVEFVGDINPWDTPDMIDSVVPEDIQDKMAAYIPIYKGVNPPNIEGDYLISPFITVYCEDQGNGGYDPGEYVTERYIRFSNQNSTTNTLDYESRTVTSSSYNEGKGAFISGSGNDFTAFFNTEGTSSDIYTKTALVISGTKTDAGIANLYYAFIMVEKGYDPNGIIMKEGVFRVFKDEDALAENYSWVRSMTSTSANPDLTDITNYVYPRK